MYDKKSSFIRKIPLHTILSIIMMIITALMIIYNFFTHKYQTAGYISYDSVIILFP
ncbi:unnamed protein product, partial [marine sediment metagenome]